MVLRLPTKSLTLSLPSHIALPETSVRHSPCPPLSSHEGFRVLLKSRSYNGLPQFACPLPAPPLNYVYVSSLPFRFLPPPLDQPPFPSLVGPPVYSNGSILGLEAERYSYKFPFWCPISVFFLPPDLIQIRSVPPVRPTYKVRQFPPNPPSLPSPPRAPLGSVSFPLSWGRGSPVNRCPPPPPRPFLSESRILCAFALKSGFRSFVS